MPRTRACMVMVLAILCSLTAAGTLSANASAPPSDSIRGAVGAVIPALMRSDHIPGMAVAVTYRGKACIFNYGVASVSPRIRVSADTLFELGSVTKTFTATLASWAKVQHRLSFSDTTARYLPALQGTPFGKVTLLSLGTHTPGGMPLQFPVNLAGNAQLIRYFRAWRPSYPMGTYRTYANPGIGMLGFITANAMGGDFSALMQQRLFPALGLRHTFITIPANEEKHYAWGYTDDQTPIRMKPGMLADEAYGIRTTASDMIRFVQENIDPSGLPETVQQAILQTHTGYFHAGPMTQDLIWEQYPYPVALPALQQGNSPDMIFKPMRVAVIAPPQPPAQNTWLNKTGSTNGFATYVAFVPSQRVGIVLLANKSYPIADRVTAAYRILASVLRNPSAAVTARRSRSLAQRHASRPGRR